MEIRAATRDNRFFRLLPLLAVLLSLSAQAQTAYYWDTNGATAGSSDGTTASGIWSRGYGVTNWSTDPDGTEATVDWTFFGKATFSAGSNATGAYTVTLGSDIDIGGFDFRLGHVTINGGPYALKQASGSPSYIFNVEAGASGTISAQLALSNSSVTKTGAGMLTITSDFSFGSSFLINGGTLATEGISSDDGFLGIGHSGSATLDYWGGTSSVGNLTLGSQAGVSGTLIIQSSSTGLGVEQSLVIGQAGTGRVEINGGYFGALDYAIFTAPIVLGASATGSGTVNVNAGGTFQVPDLTNGLAVGSGSGVVNLTDGTIKVVRNPYHGTGTFTTSAPITLTGDSTFDTNSYDAALFGSLTGTGSLIKAGTGTLTLGTAPNYEGSTTIAGGTLAIGSGVVLESSAGIVLAPNSGDNATLAIPTGGTLRLNGGVGLTQGAGTAALEFSGGQLEVLEASTLSMPIKLNSTATVALADEWGNGVTFAGVISGEGGLTLRGYGSFALAADNTYTGVTTVEDGDLVIGVYGPTGSVAGDIVSNYAVRFTRTNDVVFEHVISGTGVVVHAGTGTLYFTQPQTYTGRTSIFGGPLVLSATADYGLAADGEVSVDSMLDMSGRNQKFGGLDGAGTVISTGSSGTTLTVDVPEGRTSYFVGVLGGEAPDFSFVKAGPGTQRFEGANNYTGTTTIAGGTLLITGWQALPGSNPGAGGWSAEKLTIASGATLALKTDAGGFSSSDVQTISAIGTATGGFQDGSAIGIYLYDGPFTLEHAIADPNAGANRLGLTKDGWETLTLAAPSTYSGPTTINLGAILVNADSVLNTTTPATATILSGATGTGAMQINYGTLDLNGRSLAVQGLSGTSDGIIGTSAASGSPNGNRLTIVTSDTHTFDGVIADSIGSGSHPVSVDIMGSGTQVLTGVNTYTGDTTIHSGRLHLTGSATNSHFNVASGGILSGTGSLGTLTIESGGILSPGSSPGTLTTGSQEWNGGGSLLWEIASITPGGAGTHWDLLSISGSLTLLESMDSANKFTINLVSLANATTAGLVTDFDPTADYSFLFATTTTGIFGFSADEFAINTSAFQNPFGGNWSVGLSENHLLLNYTGTSAIPEPATYAAFLGAIALAVASWRRQRATS